jgi:hypothetical protein
MARSCYAQKIKPRCPSPEVCNIVTGENEAATERPDDPREGTATVQGKPNGEIEHVVLFDDHPDRVIKIGTGLPAFLQKNLIKLLRNNASVFAWSYVDMPGISTIIISHKLGKAEEKSETRSCMRP